MSIIYEALKKTQRNREVMRDTLKGKYAFYKSKSIKYLTKRNLITGLFVLLVMVCFAPSFRHHKPKHQESTTPVIVAAPVAHTAPLQSAAQPHTVVTPAPIPPSAAVTAPSMRVPQLAPAPAPAPQPAMTQPVAAQPALPPPAQAVQVQTVYMQPIYMQPMMPQPLQVAPPQPAPTQVAAPTAAEPQPAPMQFVAAEATPAPNYREDLILNGVLLSQKEKMALINNKACHIGDMVRGMKLVSIEFNSVKLEGDKQTLILRTLS